jgi:hypothetical protein
MKIRQFVDMQFGQVARFEMITIGQDAQIKLMIGQNARIE